MIRNVTASFLVFLSLCIGARAARADTVKSLSIEYDVVKFHAETPLSVVGLTHRVRAADGALGGFVYTQVIVDHVDYAQAYGGPTLTFSRFGSTITLGTGIGIEQSAEPDDRNPLRLGTFLEWERHRHRITLVAEIGATKKDFVGAYFEGRYAWRVSPFFSVGVIGRRALGIGPRVDLWLHEASGIAVSPFYDPESKRWGGTLTFTTGY